MWQQRPLAASQDIPTGQRLKMFTFSAFSQMWWLCWYLYFLWFWGDSWWHLWCLYFEEMVDNDTFPNKIYQLQRKRTPLLLTRFLLLPPATSSLSSWSSPLSPWSCPSSSLSPVLRPLLWWGWWQRRGSWREWEEPWAVLTWWIRMIFEAFKT